MIVGKALSEERYLRQLHGPAYERYCLQTARFFLFVVGRKPFGNAQRPTYGEFAVENSNAHIVNLATAVEPPEDGIISRTIHNDERLKAVVFGFSQGQELSEHTAAVPAVMHFLSGEADVTLGAEKLVATAGTWVHMPANLSHSIVARSPLSCCS